MSAPSRANTAGLMSDAAVQAKTGKTWREWFKILDGEGAGKMDHKGIVAILRERHGMRPWWQQMVTVGYEQARGMREKHQKPGGFEISRSQTLDVPLSKLYAAWESAKTRSLWLGDSKLVVRKATPRKSMRFTWVDGKTSLEARFSAKGQGKSVVTVQHGKLPDAEAARRMKAYWGEQLDHLKGVLEK
ncbi:MAG: DUF4287 domain-containing protein [Acidobacteria bacterium]|nr:DUF4287 domain-containing protein [Acidobacteriota bacterium]